MRIGLFSDVYEGSLNGVSYVAKSTKQELEKLGHTVFLFCPANNLTPKKSELKKEKNNIYKIPSIKGMLFDDFRMPVFLPQYLVRKIKKLNLDIIHFLTTGQIGIVGIYAAKKLNITLIGQHTTDIYEYIDYYKVAKLMPYLAGFIMPFITYLSKNMAKDLAKSYIPKLEKIKKIISTKSLSKSKTLEKPSKKLIGKILGIIYDNCDVCICVSKKSLKQLKKFSYGYANFKVIPTGVNNFLPPSNQKITNFKEKWGIKKNDKVLIYVGRISPEKNLPFLISVLEYINIEYKNVKLMFVGDFDYRTVLEKITFNSSSKENIIFTGKINHNDLGTAYYSSDLFVFPSMTDTQGLVLTEAAHCGLPIVLNDKKVTEVVVDNKNGYISDGTVFDFSEKIISILFDKKLYNNFSNYSKKIASKFTEKNQTKKLVKIYKKYEN